MASNSDYNLAASTPMGHIKVNLATSSSNPPQPQNQTINLSHSPMNVTALPPAATQLKANLTGLAFPENVQLTGAETDLERYLKNEVLRLNQKILSMESCNSMIQEKSIDEQLKDSQNYMSFYLSKDLISVRAGRLLIVAPLCLESMVGKDPFCYVLRIKVRREKEIMNARVSSNKRTFAPNILKQIIIEDSNSSTSIAFNRNHLVEQDFKQRTIENEGLDSVVDSSNSTDKNPRKSLKCNTENARERQDILPFNFRNREVERETLRKIEEILPDLDRIKFMVNKFFKSIFASFTPFISEEVIKENINIIFHKDENDPTKTRIRLHRRFEFAYISIIMIMMRFIYMGVCKNLLDLQLNKPESLEDDQTENSDDDIDTQKKAQDKDIEYILEFPIGLNYINSAQMCINQFRLLRRGATPVIQCALFMRFYHKYAPEEGDGIDGGDSTVFLGMILQMANSLGLNRDISKGVSNINADPKLQITTRKLWHSILTMDTELTSYLGNPLLIDENTYDTKIPSFNANKKYSSREAEEVERCTVWMFQVHNQINLILRPILRDILNLNKLVKIDDFLKKLKVFEIFVKDNFRNITSILQLPNKSISDTIKKVFKFKSYIEYQLLIFVIYFHIANSTRKTPNFQIIYKMFVLAIELIDVLSIMLISTNNGKVNYFDKIFGNFGSQIIVLPSAISVLEKAGVFLLASIARCLDVIHNYGPKGEVPIETLKIVSELQIKLIAKLDTLKNCTESLSSCYFQAWRLNKVFQYHFGLISNSKDNIFDRNSNMNKECTKSKLPDHYNHVKEIPEDNEYLKFSLSELQQLLSVVSDDYYENFIITQLQRSKNSKNTQEQASAVFDAMRISKILSPAEQQQQYEQFQYQQQQFQQDMNLPYTLNMSTGSPAAGVSAESTHSTPGTSSTKSSSLPEDGYHVNTNNGMSSNDIDYMWYQLMGEETPAARTVESDSLSYDDVENIFPLDAFDGSYLG